LAKQAPRRVIRGVINPFLLCKTADTPRDKRAEISVFREIQEKLYLIFTPMSKKYINASFVVILKTLLTYNFNSWLAKSSSMKHEFHIFNRILCIILGDWGLFLVFKKYDRTTQTTKPPSPLSENRR
jgi:hypothetical protein